MLECAKANKFTLRKENSKEEWEEITEIYRNNKKKREVVVIQGQDENKIIKDSKRQTKKKTEGERESRGYKNKDRGEG